MQPGEPVGFVGLGSLGAAIARKLLEGGIVVTGTRRGPADEFVSLGGTLLPSPAAVFKTASIVFTCVTDDDALEAIVYGDGGFLSSGAEGRLVVDFSTTALPRRRALRERLLAAGCGLFDCPVSGLPVTVANRKALLLASGDCAQFAAIEPLLRLVSDEVHYLGEFGAGTVLKYLSNFLMVIHASAAAEAIAVAESLGMDAAQAASVLSRGAGGSFQLMSRGGAMARRSYDAPQATLDQLSKDLSLIADFNRSAGLESAMFASATDLVAQTRNLGFGAMDPVALIEAASRNFGCRLKSEET